jgi:hypothetical protein
MEGEIHAHKSLSSKGVASQRLTDVIIILEQQK